MTKSLQLCALKSAERFIKGELAVRESSYLPNPTKAEQRDLSDALETLSIVQNAIELNGGQNTPAPVSAWLKQRFPWLATDDDSEIPYPSGADVVAELEQAYRELLRDHA